jgi:hypothetical protein
MGKMRKEALIIVAVLLFTVIPISFHGNAEEDIEIEIEEGPDTSIVGPSPSIPTPYPGSLTSYDPITINNESDLEDLIDDEGWDGDGTEEDPYIIEDLDIDADGDPYCIEILNVSRHLIIRNCVLHNASNSWNYHNVLFIKNCTNILIENLTFEGVIYSRGIFLEDANMIQIKDCSFSVDDGIYVSDIDTEKILIDGCNFTTQSDDGIVLYFASKIMIQNSYFNGNNGIYIHTVNNLSFAKLSFVTRYNALNLRYSRNLTIFNTTFTECGSGISLFECVFVEVRDMEFEGTNSRDIYISDSEHVEIEKSFSTRNSNADSGIRIDDSNFCVLKNLFMDGGNEGLEISSCNNIKIIDSNIISDYSYRVGNFNSCSSCRFNNVTFELQWRSYNEPREAVLIVGCQWTYFDNCTFISEMSTSVEIGSSEFCMVRESSFIVSEEYPSLMINNWNEGCKFFSNELTGMGLAFDYWSGSRYDAFYDHEIPENNTLNGEPIWYFNGQDLEHETIPPGAQHFFVNCSNVTIKNWVLFNETPFFLLRCENVLLKNLDLRLHSYYDDIQIWESKNITISDCVTSNGHDTRLLCESSEDITILNCSQTYLEAFRCSFTESKNVAIEGNLLNYLWLVDVNEIEIIDNKLFPLTILS